MFLPFLNIKAQTPQAPHKMTGKEKRLAKIAEEHKTWDKCFIITDKSDTVFGRIKPGKPNESYDKVYTPFVEFMLFFTFPNDSECGIFPYSIKQLYVYDAPENYKKYITVPLTNKAAAASRATNLVRVAEDGKCQLLVYEKLEQTGNSAVLVKYYYTRYNNYLTVFPVPSAHMIAPAPVFRKHCAEVFADCPTLVEQITNKELTIDDMQVIVKRFNTCAGVK